MKEESFSQINKILAEWDPIGVPKWLALGEYRDYVLPFINMPKDFDLIKKELLHVYMDVMGYGHDEDDPFDRNYIDSVVKKIYDVL